MKGMMVFAVLIALIGASFAAAAAPTSVVTATVNSRVLHISAGCTGSGSISYWEMPSTTNLFCSKPPTMACTNAYCYGSCIDTIKISAPTAAFTAPDGSNVTTFYLDPIGQFNNCDAGSCKQNRIAPRASWNPLVYWYTGGCISWAPALDMRMNPGLNMLVGMSAASNGGYSGGFYYMDSSPGGNDGAIGYSERTDTNGMNLVTMPVYNLGAGSSSTTGSWGIGTPNLGSQPQMFLTTYSGETSYTKRQTPFGPTPRGSTIAGTNFNAGSLTSDTFVVTMPGTVKKK